MTHDEIMALPDVTPSYGYRLENGCKIPVRVGHFGAILQTDDDGVFFTKDGAAWMVGWVNGVRVRRKTEIF